MTAQAQTKLKELLGAICKQQNQRFYNIELAKTNDGMLEIVCDSKLNDIYIMFAGERLVAGKALRIISETILKLTYGKKEN